MKKILAIGMLLIASVVHSQEYSVGKFQSAFNNQGDWIWGQSEDVDLTITIYKNSLKINNKAKTSLIVFEKLGTKEGVTDDGDLYDLIMWNAYDEQGKKCQLSLITYTYGSRVSSAFTIAYTDFMFRFYVKLNNNL